MSASSTPLNVPSTPLTETAPEDLTGDTHVHYDDGYKAQFAEIASLFEDIESDIRVITDRFDDESKGVYTRQADTVAPNAANIAAQAALEQNLEESGIVDFINAEMGNPTDFGNTSAANFSSLRNAGSSGGYQGGTGGQLQAPGYAGSPTIVNRNGDTVRLPQAGLDDIVTLAGEATGNVRYGNQGGKRNLPIQQALMDILDTAAQTAGVDVLITSGGQVPESEGGRDGVNRTGSNRHDKGYGADVALFTPDFNGRQLSLRNSDDLSIMMNFMRAARDAGATAIGAGNGYMSDNVIHVDIAWRGQQAGAISGIIASTTWGGGTATGTSTNYANAPQYMKDLMAGAIA
jgi:hypothetical protein